VKVSIGDLSELAGPLIRFSLTLTDDTGDPLLTYPGWTYNVYREVMTPATRTARGFYTRFSEASSVFEKQLRDALETFPEVERILGPKQEKVKNKTKKIVGVKELS
jgi:hypothetical protein